MGTDGSNKRGRAKKRFANVLSQKRNEIRSTVRGLISSPTSVSLGCNWVPWVLKASVAGCSGLGTLGMSKLERVLFSWR